MQDPGALGPEAELIDIAKVLLILLEPQIPGLGIQGFGFGGLGFGFWVWGLGLGVTGLRSGAQASGLRACKVGLRALGVLLKTYMTGGGGPFKGCSYKAYTGYLDVLE